LLSNFASDLLRNRFTVNNLCCHLGRNPSINNYGGMRLFWQKLRALSGVES